MKLRINWLILSSVLLSIFSSSCVAADSPPRPLGSEISTFEDCMAGPHKMLKTFPAQCISADGKIFVDSRGAVPEKGICKDNCGNGICEEIVCMGQGCPCPESSTSCPADCHA